MRRTDYEFKEEVLRRAEAYRQRRRKRAKVVAAICLPVILCSGGLLALLSIGMGGSSTSVAMDADKSAQYVEAPAAAAPEAIEEECAMDSVMDLEPGEGNTQNSKTQESVISITVTSIPEQEDAARVFTDEEHISAIMETINDFRIDPETVIGGDEVGNREGLAHEITVTGESGSQKYVLFLDALLDEDVWYINSGCYQELEKLIILEGN